MRKAHERWSSFHLNESINDFGERWPAGTTQLTKDLVGFYRARMGLKRKEFLSAFEHCLRIIRMLWPKTIEIYKDTTKGRIWNNYFLDVIQEACQFRDLVITGPASAAKTFGISVFANINFYCAPNKTLVMISTTSGSASERRIWGDVKDLHRDAKWEQNGYIGRNGVAPIGEVIEYLKTLTFDENKTLSNSNINERDLRNSVTVIPISDDSKGESALATIMGSKNESVLWIVDELPAMMDNVDKPNLNLRANPFFQFIGIGNANRKSDPHGVLCEPRDGWDSISDKEGGAWISRKGKTVLFLHGEDSPNEHPIVSHLNEKKKLPFPYLSNRFDREEIAIEAGNGDREMGLKSLDYYRFGIGIWVGDDYLNTVISEKYVKHFSATDDPIPWIGDGRVRTFCGADFAFTSGGDNNALFFIEHGYNYLGDPQIVLDKINIVISPNVETKEEFRRAVAKEIVRYCIKRNVDPLDFGCDISNDGGLMLQAIEIEWSASIGSPVRIVGLSSQGKATNEKYGKMVSQYWLSTRELISGGCVRGFNILSGYASDLFKRLVINNGRNVNDVESKIEMKKRIRRSPDFGDSFCYAVHLLIASGLTISKINNTEEKPIDRKGLSKWFTKDDENSDEEQYSDYVSEYEEALV